MSSNWLKQKKKKKRERERETIWTHIQGNLRKYWEIQGWAGLASETQLTSSGMCCCHLPCCLIPFFSSKLFLQSAKMATSNFRFASYSLTPPVESMYFSHSSIISAKVSRVSCKYPRVNHNPIQEAITVTSISRACISCPPRRRRGGRTSLSRTTRTGSCGGELEWGVPRIKAGDATKGRGVIMLSQHTQQRATMLSDVLQRKKIM